MENTTEQTVTEEQLLQVRRLIESVVGKDHTFTDYQIKVFAEGYLLEPFVEAEFDFYMYLNWLGDLTQGDFKEKLTKLFATKIEETHRKNAERVGWSLTAVGSGSVDPTFTYTVGLTRKLGYELIVTNLPPDLSQPLLNEVCTALTENTLPIDEPFTTSSFTVNGEPARLKIVDIDFDSVTAKSVMARIDGIEVTQIKQLWLSDGDNILPDEPGYDNTFVQYLIGT